MRFLCDQMLGSLAKWLRILGHDAAYVREGEGDDDRLLERAADEERVLLTRDKELADRAAGAVLIEGTSLERQLRRVFDACDVEVSVDAMLSRCTVCNVPVVAVDKTEVRGDVPEHAYEMHERFWRCPSCGRVYWKGTHWDNMRGFIERFG
jgi:hypothetical protein